MVEIHPAQGGRDGRERAEAAFALQGDVVGLHRADPVRVEAAPGPVVPQGQPRAAPRPEGREAPHVRSPGVWPEEIGDEVSRDEVVEEHLPEAPAGMGRVAEDVDLPDLHFRIGREPGQVEDQVVEARDRLPAQRGHHRHRGHVVDADQAGDVEGSLPLDPLGPRPHHQGAHAASAQAGGDPGVEAIAGHARSSGHPHRGEGHAVDPDDPPVLLGDEGPAASVGGGTGEEVPAGLDEGCAGIGRRAIQ